LWNAWRRQHPSIVPNLTRISLSVTERQMGQVNGGPINLASARLRRASLRFATLSGANLDSADLSGADLTDARLDGANLSNADLGEAVLDRTDFTDARLAGANLCGANLSKARNLTVAQLAEAFGNEATTLPLSLKAPESWAAPTPVKVEPPLAVTPIAPVARDNRASTVSWLVGGPLQTS
jgi:uncharacterized protein YjbI with pentapeptide repeats